MHSRGSAVARRPTRCSPRLRTSELTDDDHARFAFLRASNMLWVLADPARAKDLIDDAARTTSPQARGYIDAFLTVYWFAMDQPGLAMEASKDLALEDLPAVVDAEIAWTLAAISADAGRTTEAVAIADAGYTVATRSFDAPQMRFNIADAHVSALLLSGRVSDAVDVAERVRQQAADLPGAAHLLGAAVAGRAALGAGRLDTACLLLRARSRCVVRLGLCHRLGIPLSRPTLDCPRHPGFTCRGSRRACHARQRCNVLFGRWTMSGAWPARGWPLARAPSVRRSPSCCRRPKGLELTGNSRQK